MIKEETAFTQEEEDPATTIEEDPTMGEYLTPEEVVLRSDSSRRSCYLLG